MNCEVFFEIEGPFRAHVRRYLTKLAGNGRSYPPERPFSLEKESDGLHFRKKKAKRKASFLEHRPGGQFSVCTNILTNLWTVMWCSGSNPL